MQSLRDWTALRQAAMLAVMPHVISAPPDPDCTAALPDCDFADAFGVTVSRPDVDPAAVNRLAFGTLPAWASALMTVRNAVMGRLGYNVPETRHGFPVLESAPGMMLTGLDDAHLDFRALIRVLPGAGGGSRITLTTAVRTRNLTGRAYLAVILPFHKLIVRSMLCRVASSLEAGVAGS